MVVISRKDKWHTKEARMLFDSATEIGRLERLGREGGHGFGYVAADEVVVDDVDAREQVTESESGGTLRTG
jgi:hypothetical protein